MRNLPIWIYLPAIVFSLLSFSVFPKILLEIITVPQTRVASDFNPYLTGGILLRSGQGRFLYNLSEARKIQKQISFPYQMPRIPYRAAPLAALFYVPLSFLSIGMAYSLYLFISISLFCLLFWLLKQVFFRELSPLLYFLIAYSFTPLLVGLLQGQPTVIEFSSFVLSLIFFYRRQYLTSGLFLSLLTFKPHIFLPIFIILLSTRKIRFFSGAALGSFLGLTTSIALVGLPSLLSYPRFLTYTENPTFGTYLEGSSSILSFMTLYLPKNISFFIIVLLITCFLIFLIILSANSRFHITSALSLFSFASLVGLTFSFHTGHHDLILLIIPIFFFLSQKKYLFCLLLFFITLPYWLNPIMVIRPFIYLFIALTQIPKFWPPPLSSKP